MLSLAPKGPCCPGDTGLAQPRGPRPGPWGRPPSHPWAYSLALGTHPGTLRAPGLCWLQDSMRKRGPPQGPGDEGARTPTAIPLHPHFREPDPTPPARPTGEGCGREPGGRHARCSTALCWRLPEPPSLGQNTRWLGERSLSQGADARWGPGQRREGLLPAGPEDFLEEGAAELGPEGS